MKIHYYFLFVTAFAIFLLILFLIKKKPLLYYFFISNLFIVNVSILTAFWTIEGVFIEYPHLYRVASPLHYLIAPFAFFTVRLALIPEKKFRAYDLIHFIPFFLHFIELIPFYIQSSDQKLAFLYNNYKATSNNPWLVIDGLFLSFRDHIIIKFTLLFLYTSYSLYLISQFRANAGKLFLEKNKFLYSFITFETINKLLLSISTLILAIYFINNEYVIMILPPIFFGIDIVISAAIILIYPSLLLGFKPIKTNFSGIPKKNNSLVHNEISNRDKEKNDLIERNFALIELVMQKNQLFLKENFTREKLSEITRIPVSTITKIIHVKAGLSFNDYINNYRIDFLYATLKSNPSWFDYTLEAMAYKIGFSNRATFNNALKRIKGLKPNEMIYQLKNLYKKDH